MTDSFDSDSSDLITKSHSYISDLEVWLDVLNERPESIVLSNAAREYQYSLLALLQGQYRYSFVALRLFLEMSLASLQFSAHEIELRFWTRGQQDFNWQKLISSENGVLSSTFVNAFCEPLRDDSALYRSIAEKVYRECSEFVHGNAHTHNELSQPISMNMAIFTDWHTRAQNIWLVISFALCARYIAFLDFAELQKLEHVITDNLGHHAAVRAFLGGVTEGPA